MYLLKSFFRFSLLQCFLTKACIPGKLPVAQIVSLSTMAFKIGLLEKPFNRFRNGLAPDHIFNDYVDYRVGLDTTICMIGVFNFTYCRPIIDLDVPLARSNKVWTMHTRSISESVKRSSNSSNCERVKWPFSDGRILAKSVFTLRKRWGCLWDWDTSRFEETER